MSEEPETLEAKVEKIAIKMADDLLVDKLPSPQFMDIFKSLAQYLTVRHKIGRSEEEETQGEDFGTFRKSISSAG